MMTIECAKSKRRVFRYLKIGNGRFLHCCLRGWIIRDYSIRDGNEVECQRDNLSGMMKETVSE